MTSNCIVDHHSNALNSTPNRALNNPGPSRRVMVLLARSTDLTYWSTYGHQALDLFFMAYRSTATGAIRRIDCTPLSIMSVTSAERFALQGSRHRSPIRSDQ